MLKITYLVIFLCFKYFLIIIIRIYLFILLKLCLFINDFDNFIYYLYIDYYFFILLLHS